jgi:AcrR family transcriptional regulator
MNTKITRRASTPGAARRPPRARAPSTRRIGAEDSATRAALLDAALRLMLEEGYAAVTSRRVAAKAGLKPQLVHYYFRTMDELFLALLQQGVNHNVEELKRVLASPQPLRELWEFNTQGTRLVVEFTALANHRPAIRAELAAQSDRHRRMQVEALSSLVATRGSARESLPTAAVVVLITALSRILAMEREIIGYTTGHAEVMAAVEHFLTEYESELPAQNLKRSKRG